MFYHFIWYYTSTDSIVNAIEKSLVWPVPVITNRRVWWLLTRGWKSRNVCAVISRFSTNYKITVYACRSFTGGRRPCDLTTEPRPLRHDERCTPRVQNYKRNATGARWMGYRYYWAIDETVLGYGPSSSPLDARFLGSGGGGNRMSYSYVGDQTLIIACPPAPDPMPVDSV